MFKNVASQKIQVFAFDATTSVPKTGDAANITAYVSKDHGAVTVLGDTSATEMDATNAPGVYVFDLTQGETNADELTFSAKSATANIKIVPRFVSTNPPNFTAASVDSNGRVDVIKIAGTTQTARDIGASVLLSTGTGTGQLDFTSGIVKANVTQLLGTAWLTPGTAGTPDVNVKLWNALSAVALPVVPTVAGRTLDISAGGEAGLDWANVGSPTTALALTGTTIAVTQKVDVDTIKTNPVANAGTVTFPTNATLASTTNITAGTIATVTTVTNQLTGAQIATAIWQDTTAGDFTTALSVGKSIMNGVALGTGLTINAYTGNTVQTGDNYARLGAPAGASVSADVAAVKVDTAGVKVQTDKMTFTVANQMDSNVLSLNGDATAAANVAKTTRAIVRCTVGAASSTTSIVTSACSPAGVDADQLKGRIITFDATTATTGLRGQSTDITASSAAATPTLTVTALTQAPASGDSFSIT